MSGVGLGGWEKTEPQFGGNPVREVRCLHPLPLAPLPFSQLWCCPGIVGREEKREGKEFGLVFAQSMLEWGQVDWSTLQPCSFVRAWL